MGSARQFYGRLRQRSHVEGETRSQPAQSARLYRPVHSDACQGRAVRSHLGA